MIFNRINLLGKCYAQIFDMESFLRGPFGSTSILQYESTKKKSSSVIGDVALSLQFDSLWTIIHSNVWKNKSSKEELVCMDIKVELDWL